MDIDGIIPVTDDMTPAERRAARKHNRELWIKEIKENRKKEDLIREEKYGNTDQ